MAGGQDIHDLHTIALEDGGVDERRYISPSLVYVCQTQQERDDKEAVHVDIDGKQVAFWAGNKVEADDTLPQSRVFKSAKRLLGYGNPHSLQCSYLGPEKIPIQGAHAVRALATYLVRSAEKHFEARTTDGRKPKLKKAVVAVPNSFTPAKIKQMKECCMVGSIESVEHIYEAEAVLMFYLWREEQLKRDGSQRSVEDTEKLRRAGGESVLVCDFGGGSVNFTYARVTTSERKTRVEVLQRLGFALGGDRFDFEIAHVLWERLRKDRTYQGHNPFKMNPTTEEVELRARIWKEAELQKKKLASNRASELLRINNDEFSRAIRSDITQGDVTGASGIKEVFRQLSDGVAELVQLVQGENQTSKAPSGPHTLIFSGRSTRFPGVQEVISTRLEELFTGTGLVTVHLGDHAKTCVALGAAYWALQRGQVDLVPHQAFAHYGVRQTQSNRFMDFRFIPVIESGKQFQNGFCTAEKRHLHFRLDSRLVFYQVMGADPSAILKDEKNYSRYSILAECTINTNDEVQKIAMTLHVKDDRFEIHVFQKNQELSGEGFYTVHDIRDEGDESSAWLLQ